MRWLDIEQVILSLSIFLGLNAVYSLSAWLFPPVAVGVVVGLVGCTLIAYTLSR